MKFKTTIYGVQETEERLMLEMFLVGNDCEYKINHNGNYSCWLTKPQIDDLMDKGYSLNVW